MKNREKYAQEMIDIVLSDNDIAISRKLRFPFSCFNYECENCLRSIGGTEETCGIGVCSFDRLCKWAEEEYVEPPILDEKEKEFLQFQYDHIRPEILTFVKSMHDGTNECLVMRSGNTTGTMMPFEAKKMYQNMEINKKYTPEELGLKKRKAAFRLEDYIGKFCMHCNTEEKARTFFTLLDKNGSRWASGDRYTERNKVLNYGENTCVFFNDGTIGSIEGATFGHCEILEFDDFEWESLK